MRTFENKPGVAYDALKTTVIFAEDMNEIVGAIETLQGEATNTAILTGAGAPSDANGENGDLYINTTNGDVYQKSAGTWGASVMNIIGPTGATGADGADGADGATGPAGPANTVYGASDGATVTFDVDTNGGIQSVTLGGNRTLAVTCTTNRAFVLILKQDATGTRVPVWFSGISWAGGSAPTLTTTANKTDTFGFIRTGAGAYLGYVIGQNA